MTSVRSILGERCENLWGFSQEPDHLLRKNLVPDFVEVPFGIIVVAFQVRLHTQNPGPGFRDRVSHSVQRLTTIFFPTPGARRNQCVDHFNPPIPAQPIERLNREFYRRTRVASLFPNEASLLRLISALAAEASEEWETGRIYLTLESE